MKQRVSALVRDGVLKFEGILVRGGQGGDANAARKWLEAHQKRGPWTCSVCHESVGAEGERVVVFIDPADSDYFEIVHRQHAD